MIPAWQIRHRRAGCPSARSHARQHADDDAASVADDRERSDQRQCQAQNGEPTQAAMIWHAPSGGGRQAAWSATGGEQSGHGTFLAPGTSRQSSSVRRTKGHGEIQRPPSLL